MPPEPRGRVIWMPPEPRQHRAQHAHQTVETAALPPMPPIIFEEPVSSRGARVKLCSYGLGLDPADLQRHEGVDLVDVG